MRIVRGRWRLALLWLGALAVCMAIVATETSARTRSDPVPGDVLGSLVTAALQAGVASPTGRIEPPIDVMFRRIVFVLSRDPVLAARLPARERLLAIAPDGVVLGAVDGNETGVALGVSFDEPLRRPGAGIVLVHNHPRGAGLSGADLGQLSKPGVVGIVAVGHDGSVYAASAGPLYDANRFETSVYPLVRNEVLGQMRLEAPGAHLEMQTFDPHVEHVIALALDKARAIRYRAGLGGARRESYGRVSLAGGHIAESVGSRLNARLKTPPGRSDQQ